MKGKSSKERTLLGQTQEESHEPAEVSGKPFDISKQEVWNAWLKVKGNQGAPGVDGPPPLQRAFAFEVDQMLFPGTPYLEVHAESLPFAVIRKRPLMGSERISNIREKLPGRLNLSMVRGQC